MVWLVVLTALGGAIFLPLLPVIIKFHRKKRVLRNVPGMKEFPIIGHALHYLNKSPPEIVQTVFKGFQECGKVWKLFLLHEVQVIVSDPKVLEVILTNNKLTVKSDEYRLVKNWLGDGLLISRGRKWLGRRRAITPAFHFKILEQFVEVFDRNSDILVQSIGTHKATDPVDIFPLITLAALDIICETSIGASINAQKDSGSDYVEAVKDIATVLHLRMVDVLIRNDFFYGFSKCYQREKKALKVLHGFTDSVIVARREELLQQMEQGKIEPSGQTANEDDGFLGKKKMALLDVLLQSTIDGKPLTNADIREEVDTFMFEGHDTTTSGMSFALYCIAKHPEVQQKVLREIHEVIGEDKSTPVTLQMLNDLHYLDIVLKEVLRMFPSAPIIGRMIEEDFTVGDLTIPAGTNLIMGILFMHRDPDIYPQPDIFRPERFLEDRSAEKVNPYSYIPFSAGSRNCIGQKFAVLEMKSVVSKILRHFEISLDKSYKEPILIAELVLKPENGVVLNFKARK